MKKIYLSILSVALVTGVSAQINQNAAQKARSIYKSEMKPIVEAENTEKAVPLWESTFDNAGDWVLDHDAADEYGGSAGGSEVEDSWLTMATPVDLNGYPNVVVQFDTYYRRYNYEQPYVVVGIGDGAGNVTWPDLDPDTDPLPFNVFEVLPGWGNGDATANPQKVQVNISSALVGLTATQLGDIYIRLNWTGTWGYAWFVDNFEVVEQPLDDIQNQAAWFVGTNNEGIEYGRTPSDQLDASYIVGAQIFNFGVNDQTNVTLTSDYTAFTYGGSDALLESDSTVIIESTETPALSVGMYNGTYTAVSDNETAGTNFGNNVYLRNFEVTDPSGTVGTSIYSTDGIGNEPAGYQDLASVGTNSFTGGEDGLVCANMYHWHAAGSITTMRILLANGTVEGAEVYGSIKDTSTWFANDMTSLYNTGAGTVTAGDIAAGYIDLHFASPVSLTPGAYMFAIEMYSNGNTADIRILDDEHVAQPFYASMIYIPGDQVYSNGTAYGIRLMTSPIGLSENSLEGISVYPNPSSGVVNISNENNATNTITVHDLAGRVVLTKTTSTATTIDLSANGSGVYTVTVVNESGSMVERVVIK